MALWQGCTSSSKNVGRWHRHAETVLDAAPHLEDMANSLCVYEVAAFKFFLHGVEKRDKKLRSTLNFWIENLSWILFFICAKNTENQLCHQHFSVENNYFCNVCVFLSSHFVRVNLKFYKNKTTLPTYTNKKDLYNVM